MSTAATGLHQQLDARQDFRICSVKEHALRSIHKDSAQPQKEGLPGAT